MTILYFATRGQWPLAVQQLTGDVVAGPHAAAPPAAAFELRPPRSQF